MQDFHRVHYIHTKEPAYYPTSHIVVGDDAPATPGNISRPLPDPGVDVYVKKLHTAGMVLARLMEDRKSFSVAAFCGAREKTIPTSYVERWDYAVPASDLLV